MPPAARKSLPDRCRLTLGGVPRVAVGTQEHTLEPKHALLLAWLAIEGATARARLGALLFPDADEAGARNNLRQRLFQLKKKLGTDIVVGDGVLQLAADAAVDLDGEPAGELLAGVDAGDLVELGY